MRKPSTYMNHSLLDIYFKNVVLIMANKLSSISSNGSKQTFKTKPLVPVNGKIVKPTNNFLGNISCTNSTDVYEPRKINASARSNSSRIINKSAGQKLLPVRKIEKQKRPLQQKQQQVHHHNADQWDAKLTPCKCPACTLKRNTGSNVTRVAPMVSGKDIKVNTKGPSVKINQLKRNLKSASSATKSPRPFSVKQGQSGRNIKPLIQTTIRQREKTAEKATVSVKLSPLKVKELSVDKVENKVVNTPAAESKKPIITGNILKELFGKKSDQAGLDQQTNVKAVENASNNVADKQEGENNLQKLDELPAKVENYELESISISLDANHSPLYGVERENSLATQCESFNFVEMLKTEKEDNGLYFELNDKRADNLQVIRSKLGSRHGRPSEGVIEWKKGEMLGRGAFGTVWRALTITGELIAVKQAEISSIDMEKANKEYEKVQQEVELLKSLHHKHIVGYLGTCLEGRIVSIFMQYIPGGSVSSILKQFGPLAEQVVSRYTKQILDGVGYLHSKNVIHRDLKGSNIMVAPNGCIKLIDFGCARKLMNITKSKAEILKSMKGTPFWMAPEVINETGHGKKSDIWSIGCTVVEMATAKPPWSDMGRYAALFAIANDTASVPKLPDKFTEDAKVFVSLCLKRLSEHRPDVEKLAQHNFILSHWQPDSRIQNSRLEAINVNKKN